MKFAELPEEAKQAALETLKLMLADRAYVGVELDCIEPAKLLARGIKAAFTELYLLDS